VRTYDIIAFYGAGYDTPQLTNGQLLTSGIAEGFCTGKQKLAQRWLLEFLTARGSMGFHLSTRGTNFVQQFRNQQFNGENVVRSEFIFAANAVADNLALDVTADTPADEQLASAELTGVVIQPGYLTLEIQLITQAGTITQFIAPIASLPNLESAL